MRRLPLLLCALGALACGRDARSPAVRPVASCTGGRVALHGACVEPPVADRYCGKSGVFVGGTCAVRACPAGQVIDLGTGACLGARALREIGAHVHVVFEEGQTLGCHEGLRLRVVNGNASCQKLDEIVGNGPPPSLYSGPRACRAGEVRDEGLGRCVAVVREGVVDVAAWAHALLGADGGSAAPGLCVKMGVDPSAFGLGSGSQKTARVTAELVFPNNDVTLVHARTLAQDEDGHALPAESVAVVDGAIAARVDALRALGGTASAASVEVGVRCLIHGGFPPIAVDVPNHM